MVRVATIDDAPQICEIYNHFIVNTTITFEESAVAVEEMQVRIRETTADLPWLVWEESNSLLGYCYASKWKGRSAYRYSVESTIYIQPAAARKGVGLGLYGELLGRLRQDGFHTVLAGIALPNAPSIAFHEKFGFENTAHLKQVGRKFDRWIDVGYWQLLLDVFDRSIDRPGSELDTISRHASNEVS